MQRIFREHHEVERGHVAPGFRDHCHDALGLPGDVGTGFDGGQRQLHEPEDDTVRGWIEAA